jgi:hypothetical protein
VARGSLARLADRSRTDSQAYIDFSDRGVNLVSVSTGADGTYPLEVSRGTTGELLGARVCFTNDVDALERRREGRWREVADLRISSSTLIRRRRLRARGDAPVTIQAPKGVFPVEIFALAGDADVLGVRVRFDQPRP